MHIYIWTWRYQPGSNKPYENLHGSLSLHLGDELWVRSNFDPPVGTKWKQYCTVKCRQEGPEDQVADCRLLYKTKRVYVWCVLITTCSPAWLANPNPGPLNGYANVPQWLPLPCANMAVSQAVSLQGTWLIEVVTDSNGRSTVSWTGTEQGTALKDKEKEWNEGHIKVSPRWRGMRCGSGEFTWTAFIVHVTCESAYPEVCLWYKLSSQVIVNII